MSIIWMSWFQVVFEGVRGVSYYGDIAIDDISLTVGTCSQAQGKKYAVYSDSLSTGTYCLSRCLVVVLAV